MIVRIVRMHFLPGLVEDFRALFEERKEQIRAMPGCRHLELWQDESVPEIFFTYSHWDSAAHLDNYRYSAFFRETWGLTKALFAHKAEAWSVTRQVVLP